MPSSRGNGKFGNGEALADGGDRQSRTVHEMRSAEPAGEPVLAGQLMDLMDPAGQ